ncbi:MAG: hypothetical protein IKT03_02625 [Muribaculaceae bacterium]|nr:hypothetical protein [Muribaculaceae bacterium]MBR6489408.1 hypothetical protein [Muribaculaceae bacterium]
MRSPFADCEAVLIKEPAIATFRGEQYNYTYCCYECEKTKERFTTGELAEENVSQIYNQYRKKYNIPFPSEIEQLMEKYGISIAKMTTILGFGENQISRYIKGEVPNRANGTTLSVIKNIDVFEQYVNNAKVLLGDKAYNKIKENIAKERHTVNAMAVAEPEVKYGSNNDSLKIKALQTIMKIDDNKALHDINCYLDSFSR